MAEYITKEQAIDYIKSMEVLIGCTGVSVLTKGFEQMEDGRNHGWWNQLKHDRTWYAECSECGAVFDAVDAALFNACPSCVTIMDR
jgi:hypothetical protein